MGRWGMAPEDLTRVMAGDASRAGAGCGTWETWIGYGSLVSTRSTRHTRLVSRSGVCAHTALTRLLTLAIEPAGLVMTRRMLLGIKQRAEAGRPALQNG